jgi:serine/threonine protein kinase
MVYNAIIAMGEASFKNITEINAENSSGNFEGSRTFTIEDRSKWAASQTSDPGDEQFFSKKINLIDFERLRLVGKGSFSKVYLVKKIDTGEYFAMKELKKIALVNERKKGRIMTEK